MTPEPFDGPRPSRFVRGNRREQINGVLIVSPLSGIDERSPDDFLGTLLNVNRETDPQGSIIDGTVPEPTAAATDRRGADRVIRTGLGRKPDVDKDVPTIVAEFVSKRRRDVPRDDEVKRDQDLAAGIQQYRVIDRFRRITTVSLRDAAGSTDEIGKPGETYRTDLLSGFEWPLSNKLLAKSDQWDRKKDRPEGPRKHTPPAGGTDG